MPGTEIVASVGAGEVLVVVLIVAILAVYALAMVVLGMKGRWVWLAVGVVIGPVAVVAAFLPAKPGSAWEARRGR